MCTYGYARVSTRKQTNGNSLEEQRNLLTQEGCTTIIEEQYSGATTHRPQFEKLLSQLKEGDKLVVTKLDRFARNVVEGVTLIRALFEKGVKVHIMNVGLLENTSMGNFFLTTLLAVAELERNMIAERTQAGKEIAKTKPGFRDGRPPKFDDERVEMAVKLLNENSYKQTSKIMGISTATLIRLKRKAKEQSITSD